MTTVSEALRMAKGVAIPADGPSEGGQRRDVPTGTRAKDMVTGRDRVRVAARLVRFARVVWVDLSGAWIWRGTPPTLAELWRARVPALERVPGESKVLRAGWVVFNHVAIGLYALGAPALWLLMHPGRVALALAVAGPIALMWIYG